MRILKYLIRNVTVINMILLSVLAAGVTYIVSPQLAMNKKYTLPPLKRAEPVQEEQVAQTQAPSPLDFSVIAEQNLFHPDRKIPVEKAAAQPLPQPEFVLYGILITDDAGVAYLEDKKSPLNTPGRGKRQSALRKGEAMSGFTLKEIETDKVVMVRGEDKMLVYLNDQLRPKAREGDQTAVAAAAPGQHAPQQSRAVPTQPQQGGTPSTVSPQVPTAASQMPTPLPQMPTTVSQVPTTTTSQQTSEPLPLGPSNIKAAPGPSQRPAGGLLFGTQGR